MLFPEEDAALLKAWIVKRIENTSDADSDVLADYVIALLKADGSPESIRTLCEAEIPDFLTEDPSKFLDDVFKAIAVRSYRPGAPPPPRPKATGLSAEPSAPVVSPVNAAAGGGTQPPSSGRRKRGFHERGDGDAPNGRGNKQARRGGRVGRAADDLRHRRRDGHDAPGPRSYPFPSGIMFDPSEHLEAMMQMHAMGLPFPAMPGQPQHGPHGGSHTWGPWTKLCPDFESKGYCSRGSTCVFDHGNESIPLPFLGPNHHEYDPNDAVMALASPPDALQPDEPRGRGGHQRRGAPRKRAFRANFSADGPVFDRSRSTIVVENIPEEHFSEEDVRGFFSQFGSVVDISMQPYKHLAIVKYDKWKAANDAYRSPKVIFDNRFVKVFWHKDEDDNPPAPKPRGHDNGTAPGQDVSEMEGVRAGPEVAMEEFQRKQDQQQKQHQEREAKRTELDLQRLELQKKQEALVARHQEEAEKLRSRLSRKNGADADPSLATSATDKLKAQLAVLEDQCKIYGIDPDVADVTGPYPSVRGRRGRDAGFRGRGYMPPRRGAFRGLDGRHAAYAQYSIDNRPKNIAVSGVDFTSAEKEETLRHYLLNTGEFESVETGSITTHVSFRDRRTAEKFYHSLQGKELPGVQGKLDMSWVSAPVLSGSTPKASKATEKDQSDHGNGDDAVGGGAAAAAAVAASAAAAGRLREDGSVEQEARMNKAQRPINMDYEVEDADEWIE